MITIHLDNEKPLYEQIYNFFVKEIKENKIKSGEKLPSKRALAQHLGVSLNTIKLAYEMLTDEGYIVSRERSGYYVDILRTEDLPKSKKPRPDFTPPITKKYKYDFSYYKIDNSKIPVSVLKRCTNEALEIVSTLTESPKGGLWSLREEIVKYLENRRGLVVSPEDIIITSGFTDQIMMLLLLLEDPIFGLEDPGYKKSEEIFKTFNKKTINIPIDKYGYSVKDLEKTDANIAITTPNHQFPTGIIMVLRRRQRLLAWADEKADRYIIEDDYDSDFKYSGNLIPSLKTLDKNDKVIVLGSFSQSISPEIGISFMVLPKKLRKKWESKESPFFGVSTINQLILEKFLSDGAFEKHINRMNTHYRKKRDIVIKTLKKYPGIDIISAEAGMHIIIRMDKNIWDYENFNEKIEISGILIELVDTYSTRKWNNFDVIIGVGGVEIENIEKAIEEFLKVIRLS